MKHKLFLSLLALLLTVTGHGDEPSVTPETPQMPAKIGPMDVLKSRDGKPRAITDEPPVPTKGFGLIAETPGLPAGELIDVLKQHYVDRETLDAKKLNAASVAGLLQMLGAGAKLLTAEEAASNSTVVTPTVDLTHEPLARVEAIQPDIGYIRLVDVTPETALALDTEFKKFADAKVTGYILDLRFADGTNYAAAAIVASRFLTAGVEVFQLKQSTGEPQVFHTVEAPKTLASELANAPLMLLVNGDTRGSAEVLVGALRAQDRGIVIGGPTSGLPVAWEDVKLSDGRVLRLATAKISFPKGGATFPGGLIPDIMVKIDPQTEHEVVFNLQTNMTLTASLQARVKKKGYSEAELVKAFRGDRIESPALKLGGQSGLATNALALGTTEEDGDLQTVRDIVLQRAVDILKGIRVLLSWR
ncbi:MAG: S41 family peptidase [Verrucomicrobiota bacterium]